MPSDEHNNDGRLFGHCCNRYSRVPYCWARRRRTNSRLIHAVNGNGGRRKDKIATPIPTTPTPPALCLAPAHPNKNPLKLVGQMASYVFLPPHLQKSNYGC